MYVYLIEHRQMPNTDLRTGLVVTWHLVTLVGVNSTRLPVTVTILIVFLVANMYAALYGSQVIEFKLSLDCIFS